MGTGKQGFANEKAGGAINTKLLSLDGLGGKTSGGSLIAKAAVGGKAVSTPYEGVIFASPLTLPDGTSPVRGSGFFSTGTVSAPVEIE